MPRPKHPNPKNKKVEVHVTNDQKEKLRKHAEQNKTTMSEVVQNFIDNLDSEDTKN